MTPPLFAPLGLSPEEKAALRAMNPGVALIFTEPSDLTKAPPLEGYSRGAVNVWADILGQLLPAAAGIVVPAGSIWAPLVASIATAGAAKVKQLLTREPTVERWPLDRILAAQAAVASPTT